MKVEKVEMEAEMVAEKVAEMVEKHREPGRPPFHAKMLIWMLQSHDSLPTSHIINDFVHCTHIKPNDYTFMIKLFWNTIVIMNYFFLHVELSFVPFGRTGQQIIGLM